MFHLDDLEADFRTFYRLAPAEVVELSGPHFFALAERTAAYQGALAARLAAEEDQSGKINGKRYDQVVPGTAEAIGASPLGDMIEFG